MSKHDLLTNEEKAVATAQGWSLCHVYDTDKRKWLLTVLPTKFEDGINANHAMGFVVGQAKNKHPVCVKALRLIAQFNLKTP